MNYSELKEVFQNLKQNSPKEDLTAHITFTEDSFAEPYSLLSRTYRFSSDNKAFWPNMSGYSIFGYCLDVTSDQGVRLDWYMEEEGNANGWRVEDCYILEHMQDVDAIPHHTRTVQDNGTVSYFFGYTIIRVRESLENGKIRLEPVTGDQLAGGEWFGLPIDRICGYCTLLEQHLNRKSATYEKVRM